MYSYDRLVELVQGIRKDVEKAERGNKAAGTRVRKAMQEIKRVAQQVREDILALRGAKKEESSCGGETTP